MREILHLLFYFSVLARDKISICTWSGYISDTLLSEFSKKHNVDVKYCIFDSPDTAIEKLKIKNDEYDIIIIDKSPSLNKLIEYNIVKKIDHSRISSNLKKINSKVLNAANLEYGIPYSYGSTMIVYDKNLVEKYIPEWDKKSLSIFYDEKIASKISNRMALLNDSHEVLSSLVIYYNNHKILKSSDFTTKNFQKAKKFFLSTTRKYIKFSSGLEMGNNYAIQTYSDYAKKIIENNNNLVAVVPEEGADIWIDQIVIVNKNNHDVRNKNDDLIYEFINYFLNKDVCTNNSNDLKIANIFIDNTEDNLIIHKYPYDDLYKINAIWMEILLGMNLDWVKGAYSAIIILLIIYFVFRKK